MFNKEMLQKLKDITLSCLSSRNLELFDISYHRGYRPLLTILIDRPEGGITIDECALMNKIIGEELDAAGILNSGYVLEVSSPGIDRPLKERSDFSRVTNKKIRCFLIEPINTKREIEGIVKEVNSESVSLDTDRGSLKIPYSKISRAKQVID